MSKDTTSYVVTDINKKSWRKFRGLSLLKGFNSAGDCIKDMIKSSIKNNE